jgi:hypothetical protein
VPFIKVFDPFVDVVGWFCSSQTGGGFQVASVTWFGNGSLQRKTLRKTQNALFHFAVFFNCRFAFFIYMLSTLLLSFFVCLLCFLLFSVRFTFNQNQ